MVLDKRFDDTRIIVENDDDTNRMCGYGGGGDK